MLCFVLLASPILGCAEAPPPATIPKEILASHFGIVDVVRQDIDEITRLGIRWDRPHPGPFIWGRIEPEKGKYSWWEVDRYVETVQSYNIATLATIWPFAEYDGDGIDDMPGLKYPIKYWEASNEPSMQSGFHTFFEGSSEDYLEVLKVTYEAVREADPEAKVLHAGMAGMEPSMISFWQPIFKEGSSYFDIANIHSIGASSELNVPAFTRLLAKYNIDLLTGRNYTGVC